MGPLDNVPSTTRGRAYLHPGNPGARFFRYFGTFWENFGKFLGNFGHFGGILGHFRTGAFLGIASRWGPRGRRPPTPQYPHTIPISLTADVGRRTSGVNLNHGRSMQSKTMAARSDSLLPW